MSAPLPRLARGLCLAAALAVPCTLPAQPTGLPSMGSASADELSPQVERLLGDAIMAQGRHDPTYIPDLDINQYLTALGRSLAVHAPQVIEQRITVFPVRDPQINAFAMPGGYIGINSGLVIAAQSESELAAVLAHEIGHVMQRHIARGISQQSQGTGILLASMVGALLAALAGQGDLAMGVATFGQAAAIDNQLGFSRSAEQEADRAGLQMMRQAGFDPRGMVEMFRRLMNASRLNEGQGGGYASTHPLSIQRMSDIENRVRELAPQVHADSAEFWFARVRLGLIQSQSSADRQRMMQTLRADAADARGVRRAAALYGLAWLDWQAKDLASASRYLAEARAAGTAPLLDVLAIELERAQGGAALETATQAWRRWPGSQGVAMAYAQALQAADRDAEVVDFLRARIRQWPEVADFKKVLATSLEHQGREVEAREAMASYHEETGALSTAVELLQQARSMSRDFYEQSRLDTRIRSLRAELDTRRALLERFKS
uniref:M48 family metalloprotease n=1 Tax=Castellaniella defragrans TaxID=75697 RepID=UPI00333E871C